MSPEDIATRSQMLLDQDNMYEGERKEFDITLYPELAYNLRAFPGTRDAGEDAHLFTRDCLIRATEEFVDEPPPYGSPYA